MRLPKIILLALLLLSVTFTASAHKFHLGFTQIEYNAQSKSAAITIRLFADDLENALSQRSGESGAAKIQQRPIQFGVQTR